jgi:hypothetical protein
MDDPLIVRGGQSVCDLAGDWQCFVQRNWALRNALG